MMKAFEITYLGEMKFFLGIEFYQNSEGIFMCQKACAQEVLKRFGMEEGNPVNTPIVHGHVLNKDEDGIMIYETYFKQVVGSLIYLIATRPDLMYSVSLISRYLGKPAEMHLVAAKRNMRYLKGSWSFH